MVRRLTYQSKIAILLFFIITLSACGEKYCEESGSGMPLVGVYAVGHHPVAAKVDSLTIYGVGQKNDSILYDNVSNIGEFYTPLNITTNTVKYVLKYESKLVGEPFKYDTLTYVYRKNLIFETPECGATYSFTIDEFKYTNHSIAYAELVTEEVNNMESQTVKIYYVTQN